MLDQLTRLLKPIRDRISNMLARAVIAMVDDTLKVQGIQISITDEETRGKVERFQNYGFTSVPESGAEGIVVFIGGRRDHGVALAVDDRRYRKKGLAAGEAAMYHKDGAYILMKANGDIEIQAKTGSNITLNGGVLPIARATDTAGPWAITGGNTKVLG